MTKKIERIVSPASFFLALLVLSFAALSGVASIANAQDWVRTGTNLGAQKIRIAAADFAPASQDPQTPALKTTFDATLLDRKSVV